MGLVTWKLALGRMLARVPGSSGQSVKSIGDGEACRAVNSEPSSVKIGWLSVFMEGPAGYQGSIGAVAARAAGNRGRYDGPVDPGRTTIDNAIENAIRRRIVESLVSSRILRRC
jgi:hypothetical protein